MERWNTIPAVLRTARGHGCRGYKMQLRHGPLALQSRAMACRSAMIVVAVLLAGSAVSGDATTPSLTPTAAPKLQPPFLRVEPIGPTLVRLSAETASEDTRYVYAVSVDCTDAAGRKYGFGMRGRPYESAEWRGTGGVAAGSTVRCHAYATSGLVAQRSHSDWSSEISVQMPPPPDKPPAAPTQLSAKPAGPFRIELAWRDRSDNEFGFEVRKRVDDRWIRVVVVGPDTATVTLHGRPPGVEASYRVRAFNVAGVSADSSDVTAWAAPLVDAPPVTPDGMPRPTPEPCRSREQVIREVQADGDAEAGTAPGEYPVRIEDLGGPQQLMAVTHTAFCGHNCSWEIYGGKDGCFRLVGYGGGAGFTLATTTPSGLPVIMDIGHGSASYASATLMQLVDGWFGAVDSYGHCSDDNGELTTLSPPFSACQQDDDLWWGVED